LEVAVGQHTKGLFPQNPAHGGLTDEEEAKLTWTTVPLEVGDVLMFSSWLPHRSGTNRTNKSRRALYVTYNAKNEGDYREKYYVDKRQHFPPKNEREEGKDYSEGAKTYNLATPITN
jgi:2-aminoethylphosphonate dioxygenase